MGWGRGEDGLLCQKGMVNRWARGEALFTARVAIIVVAKHQAHPGTCSAR
jgi:hypothetical protein